MVKIRQEYEIKIKPGLQKTERPKSVGLTEESSSKESKRKDTAAQAVARLDICHSITLKQPLNIDHT